MPTRVLLRPIANPLPLGFAALAAASLVASGLELGWIAQSERAQAGVILLLFAPLLQLVASVFSFLARDAAAGAGMGILSGTWLCIGVVTLTTPAGSTSHALGTFLLAAGVLLLTSAAQTAVSSPLAGLVGGTAGIRFLVIALYQLSGTVFWKHAAGVVGLVLCAIALVAVARLASQAGNGEVEGEPGVRHRL